MRRFEYCPNYCWDGFLLTTGYIDVPVHAFSFVRRPRNEKSISTTPHCLEPVPVSHHGNISDVISDVIVSCIILSRDFSLGVQHGGGDKAPQMAHNLGALTVFAGETKTCDRLSRAVVAVSGT